MCTKVKFVNKSKRDIPSEIVDKILASARCQDQPDNILFKTIDQINSLAEEYNLKIVELSNEYKDGKLVEQTFVFGDRYVKED